MKKISVVELFAGVGGFRLGLERYNKDLFDFVFANQWEPNKKVQYAFDCYVENFGAHGANNEDISIAKYKIPKNFDLLVGGFPCQDYSVAATKAKGIEGKKGVLWWEISWILENKKPKMVLLENVDRLLKSPSSSRGRDFAIMLYNLNKHGYDVEWQVINAAEYGMVQRRKRVFIFAKKRTNFIEEVISNFDFNDFNGKSFFNTKFPTTLKETKVCSKFFDLKKDYIDEFDITNNYNLGKFMNRGFLRNGKVYMFETEADSSQVEDFETLRNILENNVESKFYLNSKQLTKMRELKGAKRKLRYKPNGDSYYYTEGKMNLYDLVEKPGRTMLTSESSLNRSTHIIKEGNKYRFITPIEAERLNCFPDNWTKSISNEKMRYFCMGNALVVDIIYNLGMAIEDQSYNLKEFKNNVENQKKRKNI